jgi:hypothetical protein
VGKDVSEVHTFSTFRDDVLSYGSVVFDDGGSIFLKHVGNNLPDDNTSQPTENVKNGNLLQRFNTSITRNTRP